MKYLKKLQFQTLFDCGMFFYMYLSKTQEFVDDQNDWK